MISKRLTDEQRKQYKEDDQAFIRDCVFIKDRNTGEVFPAILTAGQEIIYRNRKLAKPISHE